MNSIPKNNLTEFRVEHLTLDRENPRLSDEVGSEAAAIREIALEQGPKLIELARDIIAVGTAPHDLPIVYKREDGAVVVAEGNRRVTALKLLLEPEILDGCDAAFVSEFRKIKYEKNAISPTIWCVVLDDQLTRDHWIRLKHTGENAGRGVVRWDAKGVARFTERADPERKGRMSYALQVVELVRSRGDLTRQEMLLVKDVPLTTLERMVGDPSVRTALGIDRTGNELRYTVADEPAVIKALKSLVLQIASKAIKVDDIKTRTKRETWIVDATAESKPGHAAPKTPPRTFQFNANTQPSTSAPATSTPPLVAGPMRGRSQPRSPDARKCLIPPSVALKVDDPKVKRIYIELRTIPVEGAENAVAVLLRVFFELSVDAFLVKNKIAFRPEDKLRIRAEFVSQYWKSNKILGKHQLTQWGNALSSSDLFSLNVLHAYVHSAQAIPKKRELLRTWDSMQFYFEQLWQR